MAMASTRSPFVLAEWPRETAQFQNNKPTAPVEWLSSAERSTHAMPIANRSPALQRPAGHAWRRHRRLVWLAALLLVLNKPLRPGPNRCYRPGGRCWWPDPNRYSWLAGIGIVVFPPSWACWGLLSFLIWSAESAVRNTSTGLPPGATAQTVAHRAALRGLRRISSGLEMAFFEAGSKRRCCPSSMTTSTSWSGFSTHGATKLLQLVTTVLAVARPMGGASPRGGRGRILPSR